MYFIHIIIIISYLFRVLANCNLISYLKVFFLNNAFFPFNVLA